MTRALIALFMFCWMSVCNALVVDTDTYIPKRASQVYDSILTAMGDLGMNFEFPEYFLALGEHESCVTLVGDRCMASDVSFRTRREEAAGTWQLTRTFKDDGSVRFDTLTSLARLHKKELKGLDWSSVKREPVLQARAVIIMIQSLWESFEDDLDPYARLAFVDASYNGGKRGVDKARSICAMIPDCDPNQWFGHVEKICVKSPVKLYGNRSACDINTYHVADVLLTRMPKYEKMVYGYG